MTKKKSKLMLGTFLTVDIDTVKPYWRNPRRVTEEAVTLLARSINDYGYQQPIVVDEKYVIIVGHTRYAALRRLDVKQVPIMVNTSMTPEQVKQYRLIDNKVSELTSWDFEALVAELGDLDDDMTAAFFPEVSGADVEGFGDDEKLAMEWDKVDSNVEFVCPACFHQWQVEVTREALMAGVVKTGEVIA